MNNITKYLPYLIIIILVFILFFRGCGKEKETITVKVPEVSGEFEEQEPEYIIKTDTVYITKWRTETETIEIKTPNPVNDSLAKAYADLQDQYNADFKRYEMYLNSIQIREFKNVFEDDFVRLTMSGRVQGDLLGITPKYTIKEREVRTEVESERLRVLIGGELGNSLDFDDFRYKANLGLQNANGNIIRAGYSRMHSKDYIFLGYDFSLFTIR